MTPEEEMAFLLTVINKHRDRDFVQRLVTPDSSPILELGNGQIGTHMMASSDNIVYPNIVRMPGQNNLKLLSPDDAYRYARESGEFIPFETPEQAEWFGKNYKKIYGGQ
jgi:hypothetical protein